MSRFAVLALVAVTACKGKQSPHDDALKLQILSADHAPIKLPAPEIDAKNLGNDPVARRLVFTMPVTVIERRFDHFQIKSKIVIDGNKTYEHVLKEAEKNAFSIHHAGSGADSTDWIATGGKAFLKHGKGDWRIKPYTLQHAETLKNEITLSLVDLYTLYGDGIALSGASDVNLDGRSAVKYTVEDKPVAKTGQAAPSLILKNDVEALSLKGEVTVDKESGALLNVDLTAAFALNPLPPPAKAQADDAPPPPPQQKTTVKVKINYSIESLAAADKQKLQPQAPEGAVEDKGFDRPPPDALGFWQGSQPSAKDDKDKEEED